MAFVSSAPDVCPICGSWPEINGTQVSCRKDEPVEHYMGCGGETIDEAIRKWNEMKSPKRG